MARILFAWELGGGFGHAGPLIAVADRLAREGHEPVFALRDVVIPAPLFHGRPYPVLQAPFWPKPFTLRGRNHAIAGYSDQMALCGYGQAADLAAMVAAWDRLIEHVRPDVVVIDNAPTLALAVYSRIPTIFTGYGFTLPPAHEDRFPRLRNDTPLLMAESRILHNVEAVQRRRSARIPTTLTELFRGEFRALTSVRELDPYTVRKDPEIGPLEPMPGPTEPPDRPTLFAYLGGEISGSESLIQALALLKQPVFAFLRDDAAAHAAFLESRGVRVFHTAPRLRDVVPKVSCVLSMAGHTTAHAALMGGRSQIALPVHLETDMTTDRLVKLGTAERISPFGEPHKIAETLDGILRNQNLVDAAQTAAREIAARRTGNGLERIIKACRDSLI